MPLSVCVVKNGKYQYIRVCESYRNQKGQPTSRTVENHGRLDAALAKDPEYLEKLRARIKQENEAAKQAKHALIEQGGVERIRKLVALKNVTPQGQERAFKKFNVGAALIRKVWKDLTLHDMFRHLQTKTHQDYSYDKAAYLLAEQRILNPGSKRQAYLTKEQSIFDYSEIQHEKVLYKVLDRLASDKEAIVHHLNVQIGHRLKRTVDVAFYDVTTYAFESRHADDLRNFGLSKDHKVNEVQVVLGLVMDEHGIPVDYELFPGNTSEFGTMVPIIKRLKEAYNIKQLTVVADRGLNSDDNLMALRDLACNFVIAQKIRNCSEEEKALILSEENWTSTLVEDDEVLAKYKTLPMKACLKERKVSKKTGRVYRGKVVDTMDVKWLISYSAARAAKDRSDREKAVTKAEKALEKGQLSMRGFRSLIDIPKGEGKPRLNIAKIQEQEKWDGFYAICTNLDVEDPKKITEIYRKLWRIEDCFRVSKSQLETRPCFVWTEDHIRGHFVSCYISLVLEKYMEYVLKQKLGDEVTSSGLCQALRQAEVVCEDSNPQQTVYLRLYEDTLFDQMAEVFELKALNRVEDKSSLRRKLRIR